MEILMKLKCSPTPAHSPHLLKNVDRLQHQQQSSSPLQQLQYQTQKQHHHQQQQQHQQQQNDTTYQQRLNCIDYNATTNINCCSTLNQSDYMSGRCCTAGSCCSPPQLPACCTSSGISRNLVFNTQMNLNNNNNNNNNNNMNMNSSSINEDYNFEENKFEYKEPEENFVSIDDIKIKGFLMKIGQEQRKKEEEQKEAAAEKSRKLHEKQIVNKKPSIVYEIIDLDDEEEREKLKRIKNQAEKDAFFKQKNLLKNVNEEIMQQVQQQQQQQQLMKKQQFSHNSPNISLVPAQSKKINKTQLKQKKEKQHQQQDKVRIIAQIELLDSSDEEATVEDYDDEVEPTQDEGNHVFQVMSDDEGNDALVPAVIDDDDNEDDDEDIPLAAAAVSCELECDDNDEYDQSLLQQQKSKLNQNQNKHRNIHLGSDDDNDDYVDEHEEGLIVRWDELELEQEQRHCNLSARNIYECFICGKRVQSNYNLRRHMMIHTGE